jgi:ankyrin repeat protein
MIPAKVLLLLLAGALPSPGDDPYQAALIAAVHHFARDGSLGHLEAILDKHPDLVDARESFPSGHKPLSTDGYTPLDWAAHFGHPEVAGYLLRRGAKVNAADSDGQTPLHLASKRGHLGVVRLLVEHGADTAARTQAIPESSGVFPGAPPADPSSPSAPPKKYPAIPSRTPLEWAVAMNQTQVVDYLKSLNK